MNEFFLRFVLFLTISKLATTTTATTTLSPTTLVSTTSASVTLSPSDAIIAEKNLNDLELATVSMRAEMLSFSGDKALMTNFLSQNDALLTKINQLRLRLPASTVAQINAATLDYQTLKTNFDKFIAAYKGL